MIFWMNKSLVALRESLDQKYLWQKTKRTFSHWSFQGRKTLRASLRLGWSRSAWTIPLLIITATYAAIEHHFRSFWPFYILIFLTALLARYKDGFVKYGSICGTLAIFAYIGYLGEQQSTVVAPFTIPSQGKTADLPFTGDTVARVVSDGLNVIGKVATSEPGRWPCHDSTPPSEIPPSLFSEPTSLPAGLSPGKIAIPAEKDIQLTENISFGKGLPLGTELAPAFPNPLAAISSATPAPVDIEVKGVSLAALLSAAHTVMGTERRISGDVIVTETGNFFIVARSDRGEGPWKVGPYLTTEQGLQSAGCQLAEFILKDTNPILLGEAYLKSDRSLEAVEFFDETVSADERRTYSALMVEGAARLQLGDYRGGIDSLRGAVEIDKHDARALESLGIAYADERDFENAFTYFHRAQKSMPSSLQAKAFFDRGAAYYLKGDYDRALGAFDQALRVKPDYVAAELYRGATLFLKKEYPQAIESYQVALNSRFASPSDSAVIQAVLGNALEIAGQPVKAVDEYSAARAHYLKTLVFEPGNLEAYTMYALICLQIGTVQASNGLGDGGVEQFDYAIHSLAHVLSEKPNNSTAKEYLPRAHVLLGNALFAGKQDTKALAELSEAISELLETSSSGTKSDQLLLGSAIVLRGNVYFSSRQDSLAAADSSDAIAALSSIPRTSSQNQEAVVWLARAETLQGHIDINAHHYQKAIDELKTALHLNSPYPEATRALGMAYTELGFQLVKSGRESDEALGLFDDAIVQLKTVQGQESDAIYLLGRAYLGEAAAYELQDRHQEAKVACNESLINLQQVPAMKSLLPDLEQKCASLGKQH